MLNILFELVILVQCINRIATASWIKHSDTTSLTWDDASAVGVYNDTIFIIGGYRETRQVTEYQWTTASYTVKQSDVLNEDIHGTAQFWAQKQHILYLIQPTVNAIATYDMQTEQLTTDVYTIPTDVSNEGCLVATDHHLYVIGGYHYTHLDTVQILDFSTEEWTNGPSMRKTRESLACITHNDYLWAFGGTQETSERISMNPISQNAWQYIDSFQHEVDALRCVAWEETIYIIGMRCYSNCDGEEYWAMVKTVDSVTGISTILSDAPPYPSAWTSPIIVDGILYVFGGTRSDNKDPEMYYYILPTDNQTNDPTKNPLQMQIDNPTQNPSKVPSRSPTPKPTVPSLLTCGQQAIGDYNNQILEFYVRLPSAGDLIFDASSSSFAIQSLTAVFGSTPIGADTDRDGILTLPVGDYNNQILEFYVRLPSAGDLIFDASSSSFAIQSW
eukprot:486057_1